MMPGLARLLIVALLIVLCPGAMGGDAAPPATPAQADPPPGQPAPSQAGRRPSQQASLGFEWASVFEPGTTLTPGDYSRTIRPFLKWTQICDAVRGGRRLCYLETVARQGGTMISWRIALAKDGRSMALIILPPDSDSGEGVTVAFGGLTRAVKPLLCDNTVCVATFPVDGPIVELLAREASATIDFKRVGQFIALTADLAGMGQALADLTLAAPGSQRQQKARTAPPIVTPKAVTAASSPWSTPR